MQLANLYLAARSVQLSQRLPRPWRDIPSGFMLPRWLAAPTAVALALALGRALPARRVRAARRPARSACSTRCRGWPTLHALSRRAAARPFMLAALYFACAVAAQWVSAGARVAGPRRKFRRSARPRRAKPENPTLKSKIPTEIHHGSDFARARRKARPHGRNRARQGRLRPQFPAAAPQGAARHRGQQEEVRGAARRPRNAQRDA